MSPRVRFDAEASTELAAAARWYEQRHLGFGEAFLVAIDIASNP